MLVKGWTVMKVQTSIKAGRLAANHSEALVRLAPKKSKTK
jgi:hypothetical protein